MKTSYTSISILRAEPGWSFLQKMLIASCILVLLFASLPAVRGTAAPASDLNRGELKAEWRDKIQNVDAAGFFYDRVRVYPADFKDLDELAQADEFLNNYGVAFRAAETLILNHVGFDADGLVINEIQANQTIKVVAENLRIMRIMRDKLNGLEGDYRLLPPGTTTTTSS
jgi:hypothetical protein